MPSEVPPVFHILRGLLLEVDLAGRMGLPCRMLPMLPEMTPISFFPHPVIPNTHPSHSLLWPVALPLQVGSPSRSISVYFTTLTHLIPLPSSCPAPGLVTEHHPSHLMPWATRFLHGCSKATQLTDTTVTMADPEGLKNTWGT